MAALRSIAGAGPVASFVLRDGSPITPLYLLAMEPEDPLTDALTLKQRAAQTHGLLRAGWRWSRLIAGPVSASSATTLVTFAGFSLLLRSLPIEEAGRLALLIGLTQTLAQLAGLGQPTLITRRYAPNPAGTFDWQRDLVSAVIFSSPVLIVGSVVIHWLYSLQGAQTMFVLWFSGVSILIHNAAFMLNAHGHYSWSTFLLRLPNALLIVPAGLAMMDLRQAALPEVLLILSVGIALVAAATLLLAMAQLVRGARSLGLRERLESVIFLIPAGTSALAEPTVNSLAGLLVAPAQLATFAAFALLLRPFRLIRSVFSIVLTPELLRRRSVRLNRMVLGTLLLAVWLSLGAWLLIPPFAGWLYQGRFIEGLELLPWLTLAGALLITDLVPNSSLIGGGSGPIVRRYVSIQALALLISLILGMGLIAAMGIYGAAIALVLLGAARNLAAFLYWFSHQSTPIESSSSSLR